MYDAEGRVCAVKNAAIPGMPTYTGYLYDAEGNRVAKGTISTMSCDPTTNQFQITESYVLGPSGEELSMLEETNASGAAQADYIYLNGRPVAVLNGATLYYLHDDMLGTPQLATDSNQAVQWQASYDPFGQASVSGTVTQNLRLPGQYFDVESGWNHNGFRDYAPQLGRYIEPDPLGRLGSGNNLYAYVYDNPANLVDPLGLCPKKNCPTVPNFLRKGANIDANIRATEAAYAADPTGLGAELWWADQVNSQSAWDYKLQDPDQSKYDDFGNFNYGATGDVFGFSLDTLEDGAVYARLMRNPSDQLENHGLKNPARKNEMIRQGMLYRQNGCGNF